MHKLLLRHSLCRLRRELREGDNELSGCLQNLRLCCQEVPKEEPSYDKKMREIKELTRMLSHSTNPPLQNRVEEKITSLWSLFDLDTPFKS